MSESTGRPRPDELGDLSPSCKFVHYALAREGPMTQSDLAEETMLPMRTVRYAINRLDGADLVEQTYDPGDARKHVYETADSE